MLLPFLKTRFQQNSCHLFHPSAKKYFNTLQGYKLLTDTDNALDFIPVTYPKGYATSQPVFWYNKDPKCLSQINEKIKMLK